jgi:hypothetical protein
MAVGSSPPASSAVSPVAPASGPDSPAESLAGPDASPDVRRPTGRIQRWVENTFRIAVRRLRRTGPVHRRMVRPGARPGRTKGQNGQPKNQITFARKLWMRWNQFCWKANNKENLTKSENNKNQQERIYYEFRGNKHLYVSNR